MKRIGRREWPMLDCTPAGDALAMRAQAGLRACFAGVRSSAPMRGLISYRYIAGWGEEGP